MAFDTKVSEVDGYRFEHRLGDGGPLRELARLLTDGPERFWSITLEANPVG